MPPDQVLKASPTVEAGPIEVHPSAPSKSDHDDVVKGENKYQNHLFWRLCANLWIAVLLLYCNCFCFSHLPCMVSLVCDPLGWNFCPVFVLQNYQECSYCPPPLPTVPPPPPTGWDASQLQGYPQASNPFIHMSGGRSWSWVKCLTKEHNAVTPDWSMGSPVHYPLGHFASHENKHDSNLFFCLLSDLKEFHSNFTVMTHLFLECNSVI